jgi:3-oxoacyl-[acyl-carrier protein] reductase
MDLNGMSAVVTGGSKGIGRAVAEALARYGVSVVIGARTAGEVERAAAEITARGGGATVAVPCDVRRPEDCAALVARAVDSFGRLDVLINNAGLGIFSPVAEMSTAQWLQQIETNLNGVFFCTREALPHLKQRGGWIINIGSLAGKNAFPGGAAYNATKFGLIGFSEALMQEVRHDGVRVSYVMPGSVATHFGGGEPSVTDGWKIQPEDIGQIVLDLLATPERTLPSRVEVRPSRPPRK